MGYFYQEIYLLLFKEIDNEFVKLDLSFSTDDSSTEAHKTLSG